MRILFISGRAADYTRNAVILKGLRENGVKIIECSDSSNSYVFRYAKALKKFILKRKENFDLIFVGFFGQPLVPIIRKLTNKPIIFDAFLSAYDTMCFDRDKFKPTAPIGKFFYWLDKHSCELADRVLLDTDTHIDYFVNTFNMESRRFQRAFVGADESVFYSIDIRREDSTFRVFYYGTYRPLQGMEYIVKAAKKLEPCNDIEFEIVGNGPEHKKITKLTQKINVKNVKFVNWIPYERLPLEIAKVDVCLGGHFSNIGKAKRVIAGKTFQFIAMKKPVILGDNPANKELFEDRKNALLVEMANSDAIANAILELRNNEDLRKRIAEEGHKTFKERCTPRLIGREIKNIAAELLSKGK